jgi:Peptidase family S41.
MNKFFLLACIIFFQTFYGITQNKESATKAIDKVNYPSTLNQKQIVEDFQYLKKNLEDIYPFYHIWDIISDSNTIELRQEIEKNVSEIKSDEDFYWLIYQYINLYPDNHLKILHPNSLEYYKKQSNNFNISITDSTIKKHCKIYASLHDSIFFHVKLGLRFKYIDGHYYSLREFSINNKEFPKGSELLSVNSVSVEDFVEKNRTTIPKIAWDRKRKKYYSENFLLIPVIKQSTSVDLLFKLPDKSERKESFPINKTVEIFSKQPQVQDHPKVLSLNDSILYIRMPYMFNESYLIGKIDSIYHTNIKKVIWDIRNNKGGMDRAWKKVLAKLISFPVKSEIQIRANNNKLVLEHAQRNGYTKAKIVKDTLLHKEFIDLSSSLEIINPDSTSIRTSGKIIILVNENTFSAANSLLNIANHSENIISIGYRSGWIGGRGLTPLLIQLPNSKLYVQIPFTIDSTNVKCLSDYMHLEPEIEKEHEIIEYLKYYYQPDPYSQQYLLNEDLLIKEAMKLY